MKNKRKIALTLLAGSLFSVQIIALPIVKDCEECHGVNGVSTDSVVPSLAGIPAINIEDALFAYIDDVRPNSEYKNKSKKDVISILSEDDIASVAEYYSGMTFVPTTQAFDESKVALGKKVFDLKCESCHSEGGSLADDEASILAGQHIDYLQIQIDHYLDGSREDSSGKMTKSMKALKKPHIEALLQYLASQQ